MSADQVPVNVDLKSFFNSYKKAYCVAHKKPVEDLLPPYTADDLSAMKDLQLPNDFRHYLLNVSRELIAGSDPTGPIFDISCNTNPTASFTDTDAMYNGCLRTGTHIPDQCFHVIVTDKYHPDYGMMYLNIPGRNVKIRAWKDFTTYITGFVMKISEDLSNKESTSPPEA